MERMYLSKIVIPMGYAIDELPKPQVFVLPENAARYVFNAVVNGDVINITSHLLINKSLFIQDEYPHLREFYTRVVAKQGRANCIEEKVRLMKKISLFLLGVTMGFFGHSQRRSGISSFSYS